MTEPKVTRTIVGDAEIELDVRKSRFVCAVFRVATEPEARTAIAEIRARHWAANHHCSAWRIGVGGRLQRSNDDGEPAGTAGIPMLEVLAQRDLTDTVAVVSRFFGGTKLGVGGLIRAYGSSVSAAIGRAGIVEWRPLRVVEVSIGHGESGRFEHALRGSAFELGGVTYNAENVTFAVHLEPDRVGDFEHWTAEASAGRGLTRVAGFTMVEAPVPASPS